MPFILNIETATKNCSVAVAQNGTVLAYREIAELGYSHAEKLHVFIDEILKELNLVYKDLAAIAVSKGPGSYTGLRIGVSAAKGFCFALDIPMISVNTLDVLASQVNVPDGIIVPMIDARRMEVYSAVYDSSHKEVRGIEAEIITAESYTKEKGKVYFLGDCQDKIKSILNAPNFVFLEDVVYPSAKNMAALSILKFNNNQFEDVAYFEPLYLKEFMVAPPRK